MRRNRFQLEVPERVPQRNKIEESKTLEEMFESLTKTTSDTLDMEIEPTHENNQLDPAFLAALPEDIRKELLNSQRPNSGNFEEFFNAVPDDLRAELSQTNHVSDQEMDNATFIASLTPDLRREVLMTANEELLASLTPELVAEARVLQERILNRRHAHIERHTPNRQPIEESKIISEIVADDKLSASLASVEDSFLEVLIKGIYLLNPINRDILASLLLNLSAQGTIRAKLLDALVCLLSQFFPAKDFPPHRLYGSETYLENYSQVYAIVTGRILDLLLYLAQNNPKIPNEFLVANKVRLPLIKSIRSSEEIRGFSNLLALTQHKLFETSSSHLNPLITLIGVIIEKQALDVPALDDVEIQ